MGVINSNLRPSETDQVYAARAVASLGPQPVYGNTATRSGVQVFGQQHSPDDVRTLLEHGAMPAGLPGDAQFPMWQAMPALQCYAAVTPEVHVTFRRKRDDYATEAALFARVDATQPVAITVYWQVLERVAAHTNCTIAMTAAAHTPTILFPAGYDMPYSTILAAELAAGAALDLQPEDPPAAAVPVSASGWSTPTATCSTASVAAAPMPRQGLLAPGAMPAVSQSGWFQVPPGAASSARVTLQTIKSQLGAGILPLHSFIANDPNPTAAMDPAWLATAQLSALRVELPLPQGSGRAAHELGSAAPALTRLQYHAAVMVLETVHPADTAVMSLVQPQPVCSPELQRLPGAPPALGDPFQQHMTHLEFDPAPLPSPGEITPGAQPEYITFDQRARVHGQKLHADGGAWMMQQVYGIGEERARAGSTATGSTTPSATASASARASEVPESGAQCLACQSAPADIILLPCRHAVYCASCSVTWARSAIGQRNTDALACPVCREPVASFLHVQLDQLGHMQDHTAPPDSSTSLSGSPAVHSATPPQPDGGAGNRAGPGGRQSSGLSSATSAAVDLTAVQTAGGSSDTARSMQTGELSATSASSV